MGKHWIQCELEKTLKRPRLPHLELIIDLVNIK